MSMLRRVLTFGAVLALGVVVSVTVAATLGTRWSGSRPDAGPVAALGPRGVRPPLAAGSPPAVVEPGRLLAPRPWVALENDRQGTTAWRIHHLGGPGAIEGFADHGSVQAGDRLSLYVSTTARSFSVQAYRMGWYGGTLGRRVWSSPAVAGRRQAAPVVEPATEMVRAPWRPSLVVTVPADWPQGQYLLKLVAPGAERYIPLTVRDDASSAAIVIQSAVTTWQAYKRVGWP